jgi:hypothetical protein
MHIHPPTGSTDIIRPTTMAEQAEYALTHEPPNNTELALLIAFIDQQVETDLLRHKTRMFELLHFNGLIARSITEQRFISRK